jgi:hypothetical protein
MRRFLLLAVVSAALIVPAARADSPTFTPLPAFTFTDTTCGFDVFVQASAGETLKEFSNGTVIVSGPLSATLSANGKTVTVNIPGPYIAISGHRALGHGLGLIFIELPDGGVTLAYVAGVIDDEVFPQTIIHGTVLLDVCAALAP